MARAYHARRIQGTVRVLTARLAPSAEAAQDDADLEIEISPLVYEMLEVDHHRHWQLSIQPAGIHVLPGGTVGASVARKHAAPAVGPSQSVSSGSIEHVERRAPRAAALAGTAVGVMGGLLGLGGAEFRLPILVGYFRYRLRRAISLNLAVSLVTVLAAAGSRLFIARQVPDVSVLPIGVAMMLGGMLGAAIGSRWLASISERRVHAAVRALLMAIGLLLIVESAVTWGSRDLPFDTAARTVVAASVGVLIGMVSTLLGGAGGELIIPSLVLLFGVPIKVAGILSLLVSIPTILVGLARHHARGAFKGLLDVRHLIVPMSLGTILGGVVGGAMVAFVPAGAVKLLLGSVLIASAAKVFAVER